MDKNINEKIDSISNAEQCLNFLEKIEKNITKVEWQGRTITHIKYKEESGDQYSGELDFHKLSKVMEKLAQEKITQITFEDEAEDLKKYKTLFELKIAINQTGMFEIEDSEKIKKYHELCKKLLVFKEKIQGFLDLTKEPVLASRITNNEDPSNTPLISNKEDVPVKAQKTENLLSERIFYHLHATEKDSSLEGATSKEMLTFMVASIEERMAGSDKNANAAKVNEKILKQLKNCLKFESHRGYGVKYKELLKKELLRCRKENEPLLLSGGWVGVPAGHAMYYQIIPEKGDTWSFRLFNLGEGSNRHEGEGLKKEPYLEWSGIKSENLLLEGTLDALHELISQTKVNKLEGEIGEARTTYKEEHIYIGLKALLKPNASQLKAKSIPPKSQQEVGNCSWKSLGAFIATSYAEENLLKEYKKFISDLKVQSIAIACFNEIHKTLTPEAGQRLIEKSIKKTADYLFKQHKQGRLSTKELQEYTKKLKEAKEAIEKKFKEIQNRNPSPSLYPKPSEMNPHLKTKPDVKEGISREAIPEIFNQEASNIYETKVNLPKDPSIETIFAGLLSLKKSLVHPTVSGKEPWKREPLACQLLILHFIKQVNTSHFKSLVSQLKGKDKLSLLTELGNLSKVYFDAFLINPQKLVQPEHVFALNKITTLQRTISLSMEPAFYFMNKMLVIWDHDLAKDKDSGIDIIDHGKQSYSISRDDNTEKHQLTLKKTDTCFVDWIKKYDPEGYKQEDPFNLGTYLKKNRKDSPLVSLIEGSLRLGALASLDLTKEPINSDQLLDFQVKEANDEVIFSFFKEPKESFDPFNLLPLLNEEDPLFQWRFTDQRSDYLQESYLCRTESENIGRLFAQPHLGLIDLIAYCKENLSVFLDPSFQVIFEKCVRDCLEKSTEDSKRSLFLFLEQKFTKYSQEEDHNSLNAAAFCLRMQGELVQSSKDPSLFVDRAVEKYGALLKRGSSPEIKSTLSLEILAFLKKKTLSTLEEKRLFLEASIHLQRFPIENKFLHPRVFHLAQTAKLSYGKELFDWLTHHPEEISRIVSFFCKIDKNVEWEKTKEGVFLSKPLGIRYDPVNGVLRELVSTFKLTDLPQIILNNPHFNKLFPSVKKAFPQCDLKGAIQFFHFEDPITKQATKISFAEKEIVIEQIFNDKKNYRFVAPSDTQHPISYGKSEWLSPDKSDLLIRNEKNSQKELEYRVSFDQQNNGRVQRIKDGAILKSSNRFTSALEQLEQPEFTRFWYKDDQLVEIELPRFDLKFILKNGKLECSKFPGFYLEDPPAHGIKNYPYALVLKNDKHPPEKKLWMPIYHFEAPQKKEIFEPRFAVSLPTGSDQIIDSSFFTLLDGKILTKTVEEDLSLAMIYALTQDYSSAFSLLKKCKGHLINYKTSKKYEESLKFILNLTSVTGGNNPTAAALSTHAVYLLLKNQVVHAQKNSPPKSKEEKAANEQFLLSIAKNFIRTLEKSEALLIPWLDEDEERFLRNFFNLPQAGSKGRDEAAIAKMFKFQKDPTPLSQFSSQLKNLCKEVTKNKKITIPKEYPVTAFDHCISFEKNFMSLVEHALSLDSKTKEYTRFKAALQFSKISKNEMTKEISYLLEIILENQEVFRKIGTSHTPGYRLWQIIHQGEKRLSKLDSRPTKQEISKKQDEAFFLNLVSESIEMPKQPLPENYLGFQPDFLSELKGSMTTRSEKISIPLPLKSILQVHQEDSLLILKEKERLEKDLQALSKVEKTIFSFPEDQLKGLDGKLSSQESHQKHILKDLEEKLLSLANKRPAAGAELEAFNLFELRGKTSSITLTDILIHFAKGDAVCLMAKNPSLQKEDLEKIYEEACHYLFLKTENTHLHKVIGILRDLRRESDPAKKREFEQNLGETLSQTRSYLNKNQDPNIWRALLVFEYFENVRLRKDQVDNLTLILSSEKEKDFKGRVMQMIMGSGKTAVFMPLLGLLRADGKKLSTLVVAEPFFKDVSSQTGKKLESSFDQSLMTLSFDRDMPTDATFLREVKAHLEHTRDSEKCLIITSKSLQCFQLKFIEEWQKFAATNKAGKPSESLELMGEILTLFKKGTALIDEADTVLNVLKDVSFSLGGKNPIPEVFVETILFIYSKIFSLIKEKGSVTHENYQKIFKNKLVEEVVTHFENVLSTESAKGMLAKKKVSPDQLKEGLRAFISRESGKKAQAEALFSKLPFIKDAVALASGMISELLPHTLSQVHNEKYGISRDSLFAIPFSAANTPSSGSEFSNVIITMMYTIQSYIHTGVPATKVQKSFQDLLENGNAPAFKDTYKKWLKLLPNLNWKSQDPAIWRKVADSFLKENQSLLFEFLKDFIFPDLNYFPGKLTSNPQNLLSMFTHPWGFTGTLNENSLHFGEMTVSPTPTTDARVLKSLLKGNSNDVYLIEREDPESILKQIKGKGSVLIDAGAYCKDKSNREVATLFAEKMRMPVIFYDKNQKSVTDNPKGLDVPKDERFTYYDQVNSTGADIEQSKSAIGFLTIGPHVTLRDLSQAAYRLRGIEKEQSVKFIISKDVAEIVCQKLKIHSQTTLTREHVILFAIQNQAETLGKNNIISFHQQLSALLQNQLITHLASQDSKIDKLALFTTLQDLWISMEELSPASQYGKIEASQKSTLILSQLVDKTKNALKRFPEEMAAAIEKELSALQARFLKQKDCLPEKISVNQEISSQSQEKQTEKETEKEVEKALETMTDHKLPEAEFLFRFVKDSFSTEDLPLLNFDSPIKKWGYFGLRDFMSQFGNATQKNIANAFVDLNASVNFMEFGKPSEKGLLFEQLGFLKARQKKVDYLYLDPKTHKAMLLSHEDVKELKYNDSENIYSLRAECFLKDPKKQPSDAFLSAIVQSKFLAGISEFSQKEEAVLHKWLKESNPSQMKIFFEQEIIKNDPKKIKAYKNSQLKAVFDSA